MEKMGVAAKYKPNVRILSDPETLAHQCVEHFVNAANNAINSKGFFHAAISGGQTPRRFYQLLGELPQATSLTWKKIHIFWVDERYVPPDSQWSNYKLASDTFLHRVDIPPENIHPIPTECANCEEAARSYEQTLRDVFALKNKQLPRFDLIVLGMGSDGHTGSLVPGNYAAIDTEDLACVVYVFDETLTRITLTRSVLCAANDLIVLIAGQEKARTLKGVLTSEPDEIRYPIHILWPILDKVTWLVDKSAAKLL